MRERKRETDNRHDGKKRKSIKASRGREEKGGKLLSLNRCVYVL
jgi:hypothetical protein